jgi:hypothetical protein
VVTSRHANQGAYVAYYNQLNPAEMVDPYHDPRLTHQHTIAGASVYDVFHFVMEGATPRLRSGGISVREATYGQSCAGVAVPPGWSNTVRTGNAARPLAHACNRREVCTLTVSTQVLGDPAPFCAKDFTVTWGCPDGRPGRLSVPPEANGKTISLRCDVARDRPG